MVSVILVSSIKSEKLIIYPLIYWLLISFKFDVIIWSVFGGVVLNFRLQVTSLVKGDSAINWDIDLFLSNMTKRRHNNKPDFILHETKNNSFFGLVSEVGFSSESRRGGAQSERSSCRERRWENSGNVQPEITQRKTHSATDGTHNRKVWWIKEMRASKLFTKRNRLIFLQYMRTPFILF